MGNYQEKHASGKRAGSRHGRQRKTPLIVAFLVLLVATGIFLFLNRNPKTEPDAAEPSTDYSANIAVESTDESAEPAEASESPAEESPAGLSLPYTLYDSGLEIISLLSSDIMNPDAGNEVIDHLCSLEVANISAQYLVSAQVRVTLTDGTVYRFLIQDLPAGGKTIAFSLDNAAYDDSTPCKTVEAITEFADGDPLMTEDIAVSVEGTTITLTNLTQEDLEPLTVMCHDTLDETEFFGGVSYSYETEAVPAGGSVTLEAADCMIGMPAVVRITPVS